MRSLADKVVAGIALLLLSPIVLIVALAVYADSGRPVFFRSTRLGVHGRPFQIVKFRTMRGSSGPRVALEEDPRITRCGGVLRRTRLDEIPQLWNVLRGDMALVGPRPEDPLIFEQYPPELGGILEYKPGLTSPASLAFRDETRLIGSDASTAVDAYLQALPMKLGMDLDYFARSTLLSDFVVLLRTLWLPIAELGRGIAATTMRFLGRAARR